MCLNLSVTGALIVRNIKADIIYFIATGIFLLETFCEEGAHLENPSSSPHHQVIYLENPSSSPHHPVIYLENPSSSPQHQVIYLENPSSSPHHQVIYLKPLADCIDIF